MPLQAQQIVTLATQIAKCPGFVSQAGQFLNMILSDLCETYDFALARGVASFTFNGPQGSQSGPYALPADWLRANKDDVFYVIQQVPYVMINITLAEYDALVQQPGLNAYPANYAVDNSPQATAGGAPNMYVWPPPAGSYPVTARYQRQMPDIVTPETSTAIPWFPNQKYLNKQLAAELMGLVNDDREETWRTDAKDILDHYLKLKDDSTDRVETVTLDRRLFGPRFRNLPSTKQVGW